MSLEMPLESLDAPTHEPPLGLHAPQQEKSGSFYTTLLRYKHYQLIRRRDSSRLYVAWCNPGCRVWNRRSTKTADLELGFQRLVAFADRRQAPTTLPPHESLIDVVLDRYVAEYQCSGDRRQEDWFLNGFRTFCKKQGLHTVHQITSSIQRDFVAWRQECSKRRRGKPLSNASINRELEAIRAAFQYSKREGHLAEVPSIRTLPKPIPRQRFLERDEAMRLLQECHEDHLRLYVILALHTLQRPGAIFDLTCAQVDLERKHIDFNPPGRPKTNKRRPVVPITDGLMPEIQRRMESSATGHILEFKGKPVKSVKRAFRNACARAELTDVTPVTLRHTGATLLAGSGVPLWQISGMLGHSLTRTTEIYAKHAPQYLSDAANQLDVLFGSINS